MATKPRILIFGGTGSLGNALIQKYLHEFEIFVYSRDENKHWQMSIQYNYNPNLVFIMGDIRDTAKVKQTLRRVNAHVVIIAAALKHIDRCEYECNESIETNILGIKNILDACEDYYYYENCPETLVEPVVCFISTDKACSPVNVYGMCKSICEGMVSEKARYVRYVKWVSVRYGNVLNTRGSIIPVLHKRGIDDTFTDFLLTDERMTRFIMTLEQSVALIHHAIFGPTTSGEIVIPHLQAMYTKDLIELFAEKYGKPVKISGIRVGEKLHETLINTTQSLRTRKGDEYYYIVPSFRAQSKPFEPFEYDSNNTTILSKEELHDYLVSLDLL